MIAPKHVLVLQISPDDRARGRTRCLEEALSRIRLAYYEYAASADADIRINMTVDYKSDFKKED